MTNTAPPEIQHGAFAGPTSLSRVRDHMEIIDALYRFGAGQDLQDRALFESAFTIDAVLDFTGPARRLGVSIPVFEGRQMIADTVLGSIAPLRTTHTVSNPRLSMDGDRATLFALVEAQHVRRDNSDRRLLLKNMYWLDLQRAGAVWAIRHMRIENVWLEGEPSVLFPGAPR